MIIHILEGRDTHIQIRIHGCCDHCQYIRIPNIPMQIILGVPHLGGIRSIWND